MKPPASNKVLAAAVGVWNESSTLAWSESALIRIQIALQI